MRRSEVARLSGIRVEGTAPLPPDASIDDGLTSQEAVAIALWNSPSFQATLADLGIARADLVEAGLLRNPVFSLLFPVGPKQLEWTLQFPIDALWQRPRRVAAAQLNAQAVGERLVWDALSLVAQTRTAHADAVIADRRLQLTIEIARPGPAADRPSPRRACARATSASSKRDPRAAMPRACRSRDGPSSTTGTWPGSRWPRCSASIRVADQLQARPGRARRRVRLR